MAVDTGCTIARRLRRAYALATHDAHTQIMPMFKALRQMFAPVEEEEGTRASVPPGERYYVIGDIHGRLDLLEELAIAIEEDDRKRRKADSTVVSLGDLVDRGPDSAGVIAFIRDWQQRRKMRVLAGNHEEMFLDSFEEPAMLRHFLKHGGRETLLSYGIKSKDLKKLTLEELQKEIRKAVPKSDRNFLRSFENMIVAGDYVFVHAGIDPTRPLDKQKRKDMLWIRERFLRHDEPLEYKVVHGHTISEEVEDENHRIGIDTGAFRSGLLTALVLEGTERRIIQAVDTDGVISIRHIEGTT